MLQTRSPRPLGDIGGARTIALPVRRWVVHGATPAAVLRGRDDTLLQPFINAGRALVAHGYSGIATNGGFLALWPRELQAALLMPVWVSMGVSSLLQLAECPGRRCGVITIEAASLTHSLTHSLTTAHLQAVGADRATPVGGITTVSALHRTLLQYLTELDEVDAQAQVQAAASRLRTRNPKVDTLVLECTKLPPMPIRMRHATGLTVLDVVKLLNAHTARLFT